MQVIRVVKKFNMILSQHQKFRIFQLVILMIIGGILETLSVSLILPFMDVVMNPEQTMSKPYVQWICDLFGIQIPKTFLVLLSLVLALIYLFKNVYLLFEYNIQYRFVYGNMLAMQKRLLNTIIHRPYDYFLGLSSGDVMRIISTDTPQVFQMLTNLLSLFTELVVSGMLIIAVFVMAPEITIIMAVILFILMMIINRILKPILRKAGKETQASVSGMNKWLLQSVQGIKELKVAGKEDFFEENYNQYGGRYVNSLRKQYILQITPRFFIEAICMSAVFVLVGIFIYRGADIEVMIPILSAVAVAAMRLLPSVNRITQALASISYNEPMLDKLIENLKDISGKENVSLAMTFDNDEESRVNKKHLPKLKDKVLFNNISYRYPSGESYVLESASMEVKKGQSVGIVGTTGSGKTTSVDILLGLLVPQDGQVLVDGVDIRDDMAGWFNQIGYIPQEIFMLDDTIRANIAFGEEDVSDDDVWRALEEAALDDFVRTLPDGLDTEIGERGMRLSGGQKQRIGIARALYHDPDVLFFDEATSALDNETETSIMESVNSLQGRKTMVIIAHRLTTIENCDVVYRVDGGKIVKER